MKTFKEINIQSLIGKKITILNNLYGTGDVTITVKGISYLEDDEFNIVLEDNNPEYNFLGYAVGLNSCFSYV
jgi:hypothetical protein